MSLRQVAIALGLQPLPPGQTGQKRKASSAAATKPNAKRSKPSRKASLHAAKPGTDSTSQDADKEDSRDGSSEPQSKCSHGEKIGDMHGMEPLLTNGHSSSAQKDSQGSENHEPDLKADSWNDNHQGMPKNVEDTAVNGVPALPNRKESKARRAKHAYGMDDMPLDLEQAKTGHAIRAQPAAPLQEQQAAPKQAPVCMHQSTPHPPRITAAMPDSLEAWDEQTSQPHDTEAQIAVAEEQAMGNDNTMDSTARAIVHQDTAQADLSPVQHHQAELAASNSGMRVDSTGYDIITAAAKADDLLRRKEADISYLQTKLQESNAYVCYLHQQLLQLQKSESSLKDKLRAKQHNI